MNSPADQTHSVPNATAGDLGGDALGRVASLDPLVYQEMRWCADCAGERIFAPLYECDAGRVGICFGCDTVKLIRFTREVAA